MNTITLNHEDIHTGNLILINAKHPLAGNHKADLVSADSSSFNVLLERSAATVLTHALSEISASHDIVSVSGYRSKAEQEQIYESSLKENGEKFTAKYVALPQCSEHQSGYAIDLALAKDKIDFICPDFPYNGVCNKFRRVAPRYGLIERYQQGKEAITGIAHEPWHFRFVGYPHSEIISTCALSLEEYTEYVKDYTLETKPLKISRGTAEIEIYYAKATKPQTTLELPSHRLCQVSGNNIDGFIVTLWRQ